MFSKEPHVLRALMEQIERPAYFVDRTGKVLFANTAAKAEGPLVCPPVDRITMRIPHQDGEMLIAQPSVPFPLFALKNVVLGFADGVIVCEDTTTPGGVHLPMVFANPAMTRITGYELNELLGHSPKMFQGPRTAPAVRELIARKMNAGEGFQVEVVNYRKNGEEYVADVSLFPLCLTGGTTTHWAAIHRDVTHMRAQERMFHESQRLESMGVLAEGIAHDFNNLLTTILGNAMLLDYSVADEEGRQLLRAITAAGSRAAELCRELMAYSGRDELPMQLVNLSALMEETLRLLQFSVSIKAAIKTELPATLPAVRVDPVQIRQVVMNLVTNASDALNGRGGTITLRTALTHLDRPLCGCRLSGQVPAGDWVELSVADTGCGMSLDTQQHLFEPFFTTKKEGHGLGMSAVLGIVRRHNGHITCESALERGTTFRVFLAPSREAVETPAAADDAGLDPPPAGSGIALIVDDKDEVRDTLSAMLEREGYRVVSATNGSDALTLFNHQHHDLSLVLIDYSMPEMDGLEAVALMRKVATVPTVVITGLDPKKIAPPVDASVGAPLAYLAKPFSAADLRRAIKSMASA